MEEYCKVLIIDDELIMRQGIKHMVDWEQEGFRIVGEASDGREGLRMVKEFAPHIVLADIVMPVLDGLEFSALLKEKYPKIQLIMLSSYDKFEFVRTALLNGASDYILKPMLSAGSLLETLKNAADKIPDVQFCYKGKTSCEMQLTRYLGGYLKEPEDSAFAERLPYPLYRILGVRLRTSAGARTDGMLQKQAEEYFKRCGDMAFISAVVDESVLCIVLNYREDDDEACLKCVQKFAAKPQVKSRRLFLALSRRYQEFKRTHAVFEDEIKRHLSMKFYFPGKSLVVSEDAEKGREVERFEFETYSRHLERLELDEAVSMCMSYIESLAEAYEDEYKLKNLAKNLLFNYFVELERIGEADEDIRDRCFLEIDRAEDVDAFFDAMWKFVPNQAAYQGERGLGDRHIEEMIEYIGIHYREDLKLTDLARQFGFSYCYISTYFKENMTESFSEYLNKVRIGRARTMLRNSSRTIAEVGNEVGYTDQSYFCRVFKRLVGVTPGRYRKDGGR